MHLIKTKPNIHTEWKIFCNKLLANIDNIEKKYEQEILRARKIGKTYIERLVIKNKIEYCHQYRNKIKESAEKRVFHLQDNDPEIIARHGFEYYFKYIDPTL